jgi:hypothetical protein
MKPINLSDIEIKGELAVRSGMNFTRLEGEWYRPDQIFKADSHGWPADWEGRVILALTLLAQSTHRTPAYLDEIISLIPEHLNEKGYFGPILPEGKFDEQHFGGHNWIIRGLIEYYYWKKDEKIKNMIEVMVKNFLLPAKGYFCKYPIDPKNRFNEQEVWILSKLQTKTKHHAETSDAGCAFIIIDAATQAYELLGWIELKELIEEIITRFIEMDFLTLHIQTHATLSGIRGILRFYELVNDRKYLGLAEKLFSLYKTEAWSEAYGNYNWFGVPRWTEPCAIIDSFIAASSLWKLTKNSEYLEDAHKIYFNAMSHGHRYNGSFGTDRCTGAKDAEDNLFLTPVNFETYWCCTMRGGEGLTRAIEYNFFTEKDELYVPFYNSCTATLRFYDGLIKLEEKTRYPYYGSVEFEILESTIRTTKKLMIFAPSWTKEKAIEILVNGNKVPAVYKNGFISVEARFNTGDVIEFDLGLSFRVEGASFKNSIKGYHKFMYGPMLLGYKAKAEINSLDGNRFENYAESKYKSAEEINLSRDAEFERIGKSRFRLVDSYTGSNNESEVILSSLCDVEDMTCENTMRQVLFKD